MAESLTKLIYGDRLYVDSCGLRVGEGIDPFAAAVIDEIGGDLSRHRGKSFDDLDDGSFDLVISLTPEAQHRAVELSRRRAVEIEYWPTHDPTLTSGSREAVLAKPIAPFVNRLRARILERFGKPSTFGG